MNKKQRHHLAPAKWLCGFVSRDEGPVITVADHVGKVGSFIGENIGKLFFGETCFSTFMETNCYPLVI